MTQPVGDFQLGSNAEMLSGLSRLFDAHHVILDVMNDENTLLELLGVAGDGEEAPDVIERCKELLDTSAQLILDGLEQIQAPAEFLEQIRKVRYAAQRDNAPRAHLVLDCVKGAKDAERMSDDGLERAIALMQRLANPKIVEDRGPVALRVAMSVGCTRSPAISRRVGRSGRLVIPNRAPSVRGARRLPTGKPEPAGP